MEQIDKRIVADMVEKTFLTDWFWQRTTIFSL